MGDQTQRKRYRVTLRGREAVLGERTWVVGIVNATPDSFYAGSRTASLDASLERGLALFEQGADMVDVGGESTRPGAERVPALEEIRRVVPVVEALRQRGAGYLSVDTSKTAVARAALDAGADVVNDVSGLAWDAQLGALVAERGVPLILMHLRGSFESMHEQTSYERVGADVARELAEAVARAESAGVRRTQLIVDPGIGFSKRAPQSLALLRELHELARLDLPLLVGPSRKSFLGAVLDREAAQRDWGTAAAVAACILRGAHLVRVHDVAEMRDVARVCDALLETGEAA